MNLNPYVAVVGVKIAIYEKMPSGMINPSATKIKEALLKIDGASLDECEEKVKEFINKNGMVITNEK